MEAFLKKWEEEYKKKASEIILFTDAAKTLTTEQKKCFVHLFYHARGHFKDFIWLVASSAPSADYRKVLLDNIADEMGGLDPSHVSHEQLFLNFALTLDLDFADELKTEENYMPFLKKFNGGHIQKLLNSNWNEMWALFSAYELLDNADYTNLYVLAKNIGVSGEDLTFFGVHRDGDHFGDTFKLLEEVWSNNTETVKTNFEFIANHQLEMWEKMSLEVFA